MTRSNKDRLEVFAAYFYDHGLLSYSHYRKVRENCQFGNNQDRRAAADSATALYHLREHSPVTPKKSRSDLAKVCPDYDLLGDVVNAAKHNVLDRHNPRIASSGCIYEILVSTKYTDDGGDYFHQEKRVEVKLRDGSTRDLFEILTNVVNMWLAELHALSAIEEREPFLMPTVQQPVSREDARAVALTMTPGYRWEHKQRLQQFNYDTGKVEPVDLTDAEKIVFTVRKPPTFELEMSDESGLIRSVTIELSPEEAAVMRGISDEEQRSRYLVTLADSKGVVDQMVAEHVGERRGD